MKSSTKPKYIQISNELIARIKNGKLKSNDLVPSDREIAAEFKVSRHTAIKAVEELEKQKIVFREQGRGTFVSPLIGLQGIEFNKSFKIGMVVSELSFVGLPYLNRILKGVNEKLSIYNYNLVLFALTGTKNSKAFSVEEIVEKKQVDGLLVDDNVSFETIAFLCESKLPFIQFGTDIDKLIGYDYSRVVIDLGASIKQGVEYLFQKGRRRISFLQGYVSEMPKKHTAHLFLDALKAVGLKGEDRYFCAGRYGEESGKEMARLLFDNATPPDAILANEDMLAAGAIKEARSRGVLIPEQLMVVGIGDYLLDSSLTTFHVPGYEMGSFATELLIRKLGLIQSDHQEVDKVLLPKLIIRQT